MVALTPPMPCHCTQTANEGSAAYRDLYPAWAETASHPHACELEVVQARQSFGRAFDDDDSLAYNPEYTAAIILSEWAHVLVWEVGQPDEQGARDPTSGEAGCPGLLPKGQRRPWDIRSLGHSPGIVQRRTTSTTCIPHPSTPLTASQHTPLLAAPTAGGDPEEEAEAREVCAEAEITTIMADSMEAEAVKNLDATSQNFKRYIQ